MKRWAITFMAMFAILGLRAEQWHLVGGSGATSYAVSPDGKWKLACAVDTSDYSMGPTTASLYWDKNCKGSGKLVVPDSVSDRSGNVYGVCLGSWNYTDSTDSKSGLGNCKGLTEITIPPNACVLPNAIGAIPGLKTVRVYSQMVPMNMVCECPRIATIELGEGVETVYMGAFDSGEDDAVVSVLKISSTVREICGPIIQNNGVNSILLDPANPHFRMIDGALYDKDCTQLILVEARYPRSEFVVPDTVEWIHDGAFNRCKKIKKVVIGKNTRIFGSGADGSLGLPGMPNDFGSSAISEFVVDESNPYCMDIDGVLYSKVEEGMRVIAYPPKKSATEYAVFPGAESIDSGAFRNCKNLRRVVIPASVRMIGPKAFEDCSALARLEVHGCGELTLGHNFIKGTAIAELDLRHRSVIPMGVAFRKAKSLRKLQVGALDLESCCAFGLFEKCPALKDVYCWGEIQGLSDGQNMYSPQFSCSFTLHRPKDDLSTSNFAGSSRITERDPYGDGTWTIDVVKDLDWRFKDVGFLKLPVLQLDPNGGTVNPRSVPLEWDEEIQPSWKFGCDEIPVPVREGCVFAGWGVDGWLELDEDGWWNTEFFVPVTSVAYSANPSKPVLRAQWHMPRVRILLGGESAGCKVSGEGEYPGGTKIVLSATPAKDCVFAGWFAGGMPIAEGFEFLNPKLPWEVPMPGFDPEITEITALFFRKESDWLWVSPELSPVETDEYGNIDIDLFASMMVESLSRPAITVKGLPAGIKYDAKSARIKGVCQKPGVYKVTVSATNATVKKPVSAEFEIVVPNIRSGLICDVAGLEDDYELQAGTFATGEGGEDDRFNSVLENLAEDGWTVSLAGLPAGMKYDKKTNKVTGTATKSGKYTVYVNATKKGETKQVATTTFEVVFPKLEVEAILVDDGEFSDAVGTITGAGEYPAGTKVTLRATPKKGYVFAGWFLEESGFCRTESVQYVTGNEDACAIACFATVEDDADNFGFDFEDGDVVSYRECVDEDGQFKFWIPVVSCSMPKLTVSGLPSGVKFDAKTNSLYGKTTKPGIYTVTVKATNATVKKPISYTFKLIVENLESGHYADGSISYDAPYSVRQGVAVSETYELAENETVAISGLPAGLKWNAKSGTISGVPTKPGDYTVTIVTKSGKTTYTDTVTMSVEPMESIAAGTYKGFIGYRTGGNNNPALFDDLDYRGTLTVTVAATGKITAKVVCAKGTYSFSANSWDSHDGNVYSVKMQTRKGETLSLELTPNVATCQQNGYCGIRGEFSLGEGEPALDALADRESLAVKGVYPFAGAEEIVNRYKGWFFCDMKEIGNNRWAACYPADEKRPQLKATVDSSGRFTLKGKIAGFSVNAKADVINPDVSQVVTVNREKKTLNIHIRDNGSHVPVLIAELVDWEQ